jgi:uncharacterized protein
MVSALLVTLIRGYQLSIGRLLGGRCRFHPSCSEYAIAAIRNTGAIRGSGSAIWRILRCGPWTAGGVDFPPESVHSVVVS